MKTTDIESYLNISFFSLGIYIIFNPQNLKIDILWQVGLGLLAFLSLFYKLLLEPSIIKKLEMMKKGSKIEKQKLVNKLIKSIFNEIRKDLPDFKKTEVSSDNLSNEIIELKRIYGSKFFIYQYLLGGMITLLTSILFSIFYLGNQNTILRISDLLISLNTFSMLLLLTGIWTISRLIIVWTEIMNK